MKSKETNKKKRILALVRLPGIKMEQAKARLVKIPFFAFINEVIEGMGNDGASEVVGAIAYYAVLSLFPLLLGVISALGFFLPSATVQEQIFTFVEINLPAAEDILRLNIASIIEVRGALGTLSIIALFWSASAMFSAISRGVNRAWGLVAKRPFLLRKAREVAMSLSASVFFFFVITASSLLSSFNLGSGVLGNVAISVGAFVMSFWVFLLVYKTMPATKTYWRYVWPGALFAAIAYEVARFAMVFYFSNFSRVELVYGSISSIIILLMFMFYAAFILVMGAEISSEYSRMRLKMDPRPRHPPDLKWR